jgi:hypothetical protein
MSATTKEEWELKKIQAEVDKLHKEAKLINGNKVRAWITVFSVAFGIIVSTIGGYKTLAEIAANNKQQAMEAQIRSHQIFLNHVLDRMSGTKVDYSEYTSAGLKLIKRESYGGTTQVGAYAAAISLACEFENLRLPAEQALSFQIATAPKDNSARMMLEIYRQKCKPGIN